MKLNFYGSVDIMKKFNLSISFGWYWGEEFIGFKFSLFHKIPELYFSIIDIQITKFCIEVGIEKYN